MNVEIEREYKMTVQKRKPMIYKDVFVKADKIGKKEQYVAVLIIGEKVLKMMI